MEDYKYRVSVYSAKGWRSQIILDSREHSAIKGKEDVEPYLRKTFILKDDQYIHIEKVWKVRRRTGKYYYYL
jgi:hypothetical protein